MNDYKKLDFILNPYSETEADILTALLCEAGFESFVPNDTGVAAYIKKELYDKEVLECAVKDEYPFNAEISWNIEDVEGRDWNEEWEKNYFTPITIDGRCVIHSSFHSEYPDAEYDIVIDPKMAFGTGHHETTSLMAGEILKLDIRGKTVLDVGTGTGILAILSAKRGARNVTGIEIDPGAYENALENIKLNNTTDIKILLGDASLIKKGIHGVDILLANINRNIIIDDIGKYAMALRTGGIMLLSGFYKDDVPLILESAYKHGLTEVCHSEKKEWTMLKLKKDQVV